MGLFSPKFMELVLSIYLISLRKKINKALKDNDTNKLLELLIELEIIVKILGD